MYRLHIYHTERSVEFTKQAWTRSTSCSGFDVYCERLCPASRQLSTLPERLLYDTCVKAKVEDVTTGKAVAFRLEHRSSCYATTGALMIDGLIDRDYQDTLLVQLVTLSPRLTPLIGDGSVERAHAQITAPDSQPFSSILHYSDDTSWQQLLKRLQNTSDRGGGFGSTDAAPKRLTGPSTLFDDDE